MPSLMETIMSQLGGDAMKKLGGQLGTDEKTTGAATGAAVTTLLGALSRNASGQAGAESLSNALSKDHDGGVLDDLSGFLNNPQIGNGDGVLKHVLGNRRGAVEKGIGSVSGLGAGKAGQLLSTLAPIVMGVLGKQQRQQGLNASSLAGLLGQERDSIERQQPAAKGILSSLLDTDRDGDVDMGDLAKHGARLLGKFLGK